MPRRPPVFSSSWIRADHHRPVDGLAHVIDRQAATLTADSASISTPVRPADLDPRLDPDRVRRDSGLSGQLDASSPSGWHKRDQLARPLGRHDPRQAGDLQHVPLGQPTIPDQVERRRLHPHTAAGPRRPQRDLLAGDVDHPARPALVKMRQLAHDRPLGRGPQASRLSPEPASPPAWIGPSWCQRRAKPDIPRPADFVQFLLKVFYESSARRLEGSGVSAARDQKGPS